MAVVESPAAPWLMLLHQLPPKPAYLRVKVWRRLQSLGAVAIKNSVYVLPNTDEAREDFEWMLREIAEAGGDASLCEARLVDGLTDDEIRRSFQTARENDYRELAKEIRTLARETFARRTRPLPSEDRGRVEVALGRFRKRLDDVSKIDFFAAPGREAVEGLLRDVEAKLAPASGQPARARASRTSNFRRRTWVTRTGVHIDRIASAWMIRRFIDPEARFKFVPARGYAPADGEIRFDMFDAEFTHEGELCTFEVLVRTFGGNDAALTAVGELVHDIDLKDAKFARAETAGVDHLVAGIAWAHGDDAARLTHGGFVFDALYEFFKRKKA